MQSNDEEDKSTVHSDRENLISEDRNEDDHRDSTTTAVHSADTVGSKWITKNLLVITLTFTFHFMAYNGLGNLQSSLHREEGLGTLTQSVLYFCVIFSALLLPRPFIAKLGQKWTIVVCIIGYMTWMAANGYAIWWTMVPTSAIVGLSASPLWVSCNSYITKLATLQAKIKGEKKDVMVTKFFGIFMAIFSLSNIASSVTSSLILESTLRNQSLIPDTDLKFCGANDCPWKNATNGTNSNLFPVNRTIVWTLVGTYLAMATLGLLLFIVFLDKLPDDVQDKVHATTACRETLELVTATLRMNKLPIMLLFIPFQLWSGLYFGLQGAEWPGSYIMCAIGIAWVGYINIPSGALQSLFNYGGGVLNKRTGRIPIITAAKSCQLGVLLTMLLWQPSPHQLYVFFIISCFMGIALGLQGPQINGLVSIAFKDNIDAAFANLQFWSSIGASISYGYSNELCNYIKLYLLIGTLVLVMVCYYVAEGLAAKLIKRTSDENVINENIHDANDS